MKYLMFFSEKRPLLTLLVLLLITALASTQLPSLRFDISAQSMMVKSDPAWLSYQKSLETFGSDNTVVVFIKDENLLSREKLLAVKQLVSELEQLPFVKSTKSLFNVPNVKEVDEYILSEPFLKQIPNDQQGFDLLLKEALENPLVAHNFISTDGKSMAVNVSLEGGIHKVDADKMIAEGIQSALDPFAPNVDQVFQMGASYIRDAISIQIKQDQTLIAPAALMALILVLGISLKHINCSVVPVVTAGISIVITLAIMAVFDVSINVLTSIVPALLLIIGSTEDVHLMTEYQQGINHGLTKQESVAKLGNNQSLAITLTFITTFIGFVSITVNDLEMLSEFGWVVSMGLLVNFLVTVLFVPAYLTLFGGNKKIMAKGDNIYQRIALFIFKAVIRFKKTTLVLVLMSTLFFIWGAQFVQVNNNTLEFFEHESDVYQRAQTLHQELAGMQTFSIILESNIEGTFEKARYLEEISAIQQQLESMQVFDQSFSFADFMMLTHKVMEGNSELSLPLENETVSSYLALVDHGLFEDYVSDDLSSARILVRHHVSSSHQMKLYLEQLEYYFEHQLKSQLNIYFTGESILTNKAADMMAISQIQSLLLMIVVIFILVSSLFIDVRAGILALIPNIFPVIVLFGVMGLFEIPLDTGTTMVAIIALGICVDDTIHFLSRYHTFTRGEQDVEAALFKTARHEATPISTTSVALAVGFATLTLSSFQPVIHFGALSALVMFLALFSTIVLTPILLSYTRLITAWDMLTLNLKSAVTKDSEFFRGLRNYEIKKAILSGSILQLKKNEIIVEQGDSGTDFFVIIEGKMAVSHKDVDGSVHTIGHLTSGDMFGEIAQLTGKSRTARVVATEYSKVLKIKWDSLYQLGRFHPRISLKLYRNMSAVLGKRMAKQSDSDAHLKDELTGAATKVYLLEQIQIELARAKRYGERLSCIILDIDFLMGDLPFKQSQVEEPIRALAKIISQQMRSVDVFARWKNQQFIILMPRTTTKDALMITQRMKQAIENNESADIGRVHMSAAISESLDGDSIDAIVDRLNLHLNDLLEGGKSLHITTA